MMNIVLLERRPESESLLRVGLSPKR